MKLTRITIIVAAGVAAFFLASWGIDWWTGRGLEKNKAQAEKAHAGTVAAEGVSARTDTVYVASDTVYLRTRNVLLNPGAGHAPVTPEVKACFAAADDLRTKCNERHVADVALSDSLRKELKVWQDRPISRGPRFQPYVEGLYDFMAPGPVARIGATAKLFRSISISAAADAAMPARRVGAPRVEFRALAGVRIQF